MLELQKKKRISFFESLWVFSSMVSLLLPCCLFGFPMTLSQAEEI